MDTDLLEGVDDVRGFKDRSSWIREAIAEKLRNAGLKVSEALIYPPDRTTRTARKSDPPPADPIQKKAVKFEPAPNRKPKKPKL